MNELLKEIDEELRIQLVDWYGHKELFGSIGFELAHRLQVDLYDDLNRELKFELNIELINELNRLRND